jgi:hypothetical protein
LADSIISVLNDAQLAAKLRKNAHAYSMENVSHTAMVKKYEEVFASVLRETTYKSQV